MVTVKTNGKPLERSPIIHMAAVRFTIIILLTTDRFTFDYESLKQVSRQLTHDRLFLLTFDRWLVNVTTKRINARQLPKT